MTDDIHDSEESVPGDQDTAAAPGRNPARSRDSEGHDDQPPAWFVRHMASENRRLQRVVSDHVRRHMKTATPTPANQRDDGEDTEDDAASSQHPAQPQGQSATERRLEAQMRKLQKQLDEANAERQRESEGRKQTERDAKLRARIEKAGVSNVEAAFRFLKPDLKIGEDGEYYAEDDGDFVDVADYISSAVKSNPWMQAATGKSGGSPTPERAAPSGGGRHMSRSQIDEAVDKAVQAGEWDRVRDLQAQINSGKIQVQ